MGFSHLPVKGNPPLIASYCLKCKSFVAVSGKEETLLMTERLHRCPIGRWSDHKQQPQPAK